MVSSGEAAMTGSTTPDTGAWGLALFAHSCFGLYVVLVKYLIRFLPPFGLLALAFGLGTPVVYLVTRRYLEWGKFWTLRVWPLLVIMTVRSLTKLLAIQFTLVTYVQLIDLMVPFFTPILAYLLIREAMPSRTLRALAVTSMGSFLVITVNPLDIQLPNGISDLIGIGLAFVSSLAMTLGVVYTRQLAKRGVNSATLFFPQLITIAFTYGLLTALNGESWEPFAHLTLSTTAIYVLLMGVAVSGGLIQVLSISRMNASLFATLLSWRLIVAVVAGWVLLGEHLTSVWQGIGVVTVILTITLYLHYQTTQGRIGLANSLRNGTT